MLALTSLKFLNQKPMNQIAHPTLTLADIAPSIKPSFSPNLHAYLKRKGHFYRDGGIAQGVFVTVGGKTAEMFGKDTKLIGFFDGKCFVGTRLISALCMGAKAEGGAYLINEADVQYQPEFWNEYLAVGRCAIDKDHQEYFIGDDNRVVKTDSGHKCNWCEKAISAHAVDAP